VFGWLRRLRRPRGGGPVEHEAGLWGEAEAERLLRRQGCRILGRRVRIGRRDEIDLVVRDGEVLVFVEVKTRASEDYGSPASAVDRGKRRALSRAAVRYMRSLRTRPAYFRFDVVEVVGVKGGGAPVVRRIERAFGLDARYRFP
jgi:putative endonuclease